MRIYSLANDVNGKEVDAEKLRDEIATSGLVIGFDGLTVQGDTITVSGNASDQAALDLIVKNHVPKTLDDKKTEKKQAIDNRTDAIIAAGFEFDGNRFSLSTEAQTNWLGLLILQGMMSWPVGITNSDDNTYSLALANLNAFIGTGMTVIATAVGTGRALKVACNAAADQAALDAVVDSR